MFTRIVVGDDGSPEGHDAVVLGEAIAAATGAGLTLVQAYSPMLIPSPGSTDRETLARDAAHQLAADRNRFAPDAVTDVVADSNAARALGRYAQTWHGDLIVIGSSHHAHAGREAIGNTGRGLLARAPYALAIAKRGLHEHGLKLGTVAVGFDGGEPSVVAVEFADELASAAGAELMIHTVPPDEEPGTHLRELSESVDLMVIGSRRWGTLARIVLGGVGEKLVADCGASLLITRKALRHPTPGHRAAVTGTSTRSARSTSRLE